VLGTLEQGLCGTARFLMGRLRVGEAMSPPLMRAGKARLDAMLAAAPADAVLDAPPGVSCPAVNAVMDSDVILLVTEPTPFGFYDFTQAHRAFTPLGKPLGVVVNRSGIGDHSVQDYCREHGLPVLAEIPYSRAVAEAYARGRVVAALGRSTPRCSPGCATGCAACTRRPPMREIVVLSGKGGTGKTSLTAAFAHLCRDKVLCDLDVDAPDLHILLDPRPVRREDFVSGHEAHIDPETCTACGLCRDACRFAAIREADGVPAVDPMRCEGCKVCVAVCPAGAVEFVPKRCGEWFVSATRFGTLAHAQLFPGEENSGRLVTLLKQEARKIAEEEGASLILCDGTPGIGCPVISSLAGADLAVAVTEPTPSGRHDLERVCGVCDHFRVPVAVIVNKHDLNPAEDARIEAFCRQRGYELVARLPHDPLVTAAMVQRKAVTELADNGFTHFLLGPGTNRQLAGQGH
jgi:MinD superfamily P-loop ATPase